MKPVNALHKSDWFIGDCPLDTARRLICREHYAAGASNTATYCHGLYRVEGMALCGVAWWLPPTRTAAKAFWDKPGEVLALSRLAIKPSVPKNAATFLMMRSVRMIAPRWKCLVTYADTMQGHDGGIYRAAGWEYLGLTKPEAAYRLNGRLVSRKAGPRTRTHTQMLALGAECIGKFSKHRFRLVRNIRTRSNQRQTRHTEPLLPIGGVA